VCVRVASKKRQHDSSPEGGAPEEGVKLLGRWHKADGSGGFVLHETDSPEALIMGSMKWADVLEIHGSVVVDDNAAGAAMAKFYGK